MTVFQFRYIIIIMRKEKLDTNKHSLISGGAPIEISEQYIEAQGKDHA